MTRKQKQDRKGLPWVRKCDLNRANGPEIRSVTAFDCKRDTAQVTTAESTYPIVLAVKGIVGRRKSGPAPREMTTDEVRAELIGRCPPNAVLYRPKPTETEPTTTEGQSDAA